MRLSNENHVVMVDDNEGDINLARLCYERSKVANPWLSFLNGRDFLAYLGRVKDALAPMPALVLLDLNMPGMSGISILRAVRRDEHFRDLPIFCMLTSSSDPRDKSTAAELGAAGFVTKPDVLEEYVRFFDSLM